MKHSPILGLYSNKWIFQAFKCDQLISKALVIFLVVFYYTQIEGIDIEQRITSNDTELAMFLALTHLVTVAFKVSGNYLR